MYRCASCGSPNVMTDTQAGNIKYNYAKGLAGTVVFGTGGAAAGIESSSTTVFKCPDCGITLSYCMPEEIKSVIDIGVSSSWQRENLTLYGGPISWDFLKKKFKNIESGQGDIEAQQYQEELLQYENEISSLTQLVIEKLQELQLDIGEYSNDYEMFREHYKELQKLWEQKNESILKQKEQEYADALIALKAYKDRLFSECYEKFENEFVQPLLQEKELLIQKIPTLKFYQFAEKKAAHNRIEVLEQLLEAVEEKKEDFEWKLQNLHSKPNREYRRRKDARLSELEKKYPVEKRPDLRLEAIVLFYSNIKKVKDPDTSPMKCWDYLAEIVTYCVILAMQERLGGLGVRNMKFNGLNWEMRAYDTNETDKILPSIMPTMLKLFGINRTDANKIKPFFKYEGHNILSSLVEIDIIQIRKENDEVYYIIM